jgi:Short C-terminal domain
VFKKRQIRKNGLLAQALVVSAGRHSHWTSNEYQKYDFVLEVRPEDRPPFRATLRQQFSIMERKPAEAELVPVKYDPQTHEVVFHFDGDARFDLEAMEARTARIRWETLQRQEQGNVPPAGQGAYPVEALERLARLRDTGAITQEEFERLKTKLMNGL